jgi:CHAD domain-containing protein
MDGWPRALDLVTGDREAGLMVFKLGKDADLHGEIRRIVEEECALVRAQLSDIGPGHVDEGIHESRKAFKRLRSLLRLARPALGDDEFDRADQLVRAFGKRLAAPRDTYVLIRTWDWLVASMGDPIPLDDVELPRKVRGILVAHYLEAIEATIHASAEPQRVTQDLETLEELIADAHLWQYGEREVQESIRVQFDRCRQLWKKAERKPSEKRLHRLRREAKYLMHQLELASAFVKKSDRKLIENLDQMVEALGKDHDLAVLREAMDAEVAKFASGEDMKVIHKAIRKTQKGLRKKARSVGEKVFG